MNLYADLLFTGGAVYTADPARPWVAAVAVREGRILAAGSAADLAELKGPSTVVTNLAGKLLLPGFTESHVHFIELSLRAAQVEATEARSAGEVIELVRAKLNSSDSAGPARSDAWIRGGGWNANIWTDGVAPHRALLDAVAPETPIALDSKALHALWVNSAALRIAGIDAATPDVPGGIIERDADGVPTGILHENAVDLVARCYPKPDLTATTAAVQAATPGMWATGIVALHNANDSGDGLAFRTYQELRRRGELGLRVLQQFPVCNLDHLRAVGLRSGLGDAWLRVGGVKMFADGALGSRTASMLKPYVDEPNNWGVAATDPEEMLEQALAASAAGLSLTIHAIGDRANRDVLNVLAEVRRQEASQRIANGESANRRMVNNNAPSAISYTPSATRHRIEHVQCIHPADLPRLAQLDVIASVQPIHATSDMRIVDRYWGPARAPNAYPFRRLLDSGARLVFGSDGPIEPHAPLIGIHAAVTRRRGDGSPGPEGWQGQERITVAEAVDAYTYWPAHVAGEESYRGSITPGKVADLVVLSQDIFRIDPMEITKSRVELTVVAGKVAWTG
jgi:predicted amidohydrolase YtcJ